MREMTTDDLKRIIAAHAAGWAYGSPDTNAEYSAMCQHFAPKMASALLRIGDYAATLERTNPLTDALTVASDLKRLLEE